MLFTLELRIVTKVCQLVAEIAVGVTIGVASIS